LCGDILSETNRADEHVFPKWLQREFNLWDQKIVLLNKTQIPYRKLVIPCCMVCNNEHLNSKIEKKIEKAVKGGYEQFIHLEEEIIFKWLVKLSYGMLFKELSLRQDLRSSDSRTIIEPKQLKLFRLLFTFLQTIRFETEFLNRKPWSILIFKINNPDKENLYDGKDMIMTSNYFLQLNDIGIISHLQDNGLMKELFLEHRREFINMPLHPIQFRELCAEFHYKSYLIKRIPFYTIVLPNKHGGKMQIISHDFSTDFDEWNNEEFCKLLELYWKPWGITFDQIYKDKKLRLTYLKNEDGTIKKLF
jgi:hypothetical protein